MKVVFRVDGGGAGLGFGHLMRCLALADEFKKHSHVAFLSRHYPAGVDLLQSCGFSVASISPDASDEEDLVETIKLGGNADLLIIDSHRYADEWYEKLSQNAQAFIVVVDDWQNRKLAVNAVIGNAYALRKNYDLSPNSVLIAGVQYLPLRKAFQQLPPFHVSEHLNEVIVTMGGEDEQNVTLKITKALLEYPNPLKIHLILGPGYRHMSTLEELKQSSHHSYEIHHNVNMMPQADVAITAPGVTLWELAARGFPMIVIQTADNQAGVFKYVKEHQLGICLGLSHEIDAKQLAFALNEFKTQEVRQTYSKRCQALVDGKGAQRIVATLLQEYHNARLRDLIIKLVDKNPESVDSHLIWKWRNDLETRQMSRSTGEIAWEEHQKWYKETLKNPSKKLFLVLKDQNPVGTIRFDTIRRHQAEININMNPLYRHQKLGKFLLMAACHYGFKQLGFTTIYASIKPENIASIRTFEDAGFTFKEQKDIMLYYSLTSDKLVRNSL